MVLHTGSIRQTVRIVDIAHLGGNKHARAPVKGDTANQFKDVVRTGDRARLRMRFIRFPEYCKPGQKVITREGKTRLVGVIRACSPAQPLAVLATNGDAPPRSNRDDAKPETNNLRSSTAPVGA